MYWKFLLVEGKDSFICISSTMRCRYSTVDFLQNHHKRHPISRPHGRAMGCLLWVQTYIHVLPQLPRMMYMISCYTGPRYNGAQLYYGCCWPGDARSQGLRSHDIDVVHKKLTGTAPESLIPTGLSNTQWLQRSWCHVGTCPSAPATLAWITELCRTKFIPVCIRIKWKDYAWWRCHLSPYSPHTDNSISFAISCFLELC